MAMAQSAPVRAAASTSSKVGPMGIHTCHRPKRFTGNDFARGVSLGFPTQGGQSMPMPQEFHELAKKVNNWGRWGTDDELGTLNLITPDVVKRGGSLIK